MGRTPELMADFRLNLEVLAGAGAKVMEVKLPHADQALATYAIISSAEAASNLARYDGSLYGTRVAAPDYQTMVAETRAAGFGPEVKRRILLGTFVLSSGYHEAYYRRAQQARERLREDFQAAFSGCEAIALPTAPTPAFRLGERIDDPWRMYQSDIFTVPASLAGLPALSLPTACTAAGLPMSLQLVGPAWAEETVLSLAGVVDRARDF